MAVTRTGSVLSFQDSPDNAGSTSVTVPGDTELFTVSMAGYAGAVVNTIYGADITPISYSWR